MTRHAPWLPVLLLLSANPPLHAEPQRTDPLYSVMWDVMHKTVLGGQPVVFDERVKVTRPQQVEDG